MAERAPLDRNSRIVRAVNLAWGTVEVTVTGVAGVDATATRTDAGSDRIRVGVKRRGRGGVLAVSWRVPCIDAAAFWSPGNEGDPWLPMAVGEVAFTASAVLYAPMGVLFAHDGTTRMAFAASETLLPVDVSAGVDDLSLAADFLTELRVTLPDSEEFATDYTLDVVIDTRPQPWAAAVKVLTDWYAIGHDTTLRADIEHIQAPVYSTWYAFQQTIDAATVEAESLRARDLGFGTIIVDDGWQTNDTSRDYAYCGDWEPDIDKFPDMPSHVARVQRMGLRYVLWIAPPLLGRKSAAWARLSSYILGNHAGWRAAILDPREPAVRKHLVAAFSRAVRLWNVDGLKVDFIDAFAQVPAPPASPTADYSLVAQGADRLLDDILAEVSAHRPDLMVEFRQEYVSPRLWRYRNMLRAFDCPYDAVENRIRTVRARLLAGPGSAAHSDPITWHPGASGVDVARHLFNSAFSVPQISVRLEGLSVSHRQVLAHWLQIADEWRDVLLNGELTVLQPELHGLAISARLPGSEVAAVYADVAVPLAADGSTAPTRIALLNASASDRVLLESLSDLGPHRVTSYDCLGRSLGTVALDLRRGVHAVAAPTGGTADLRSV